MKTDKILEDTSDTKLHAAPVGAKQTVGPTIEWEDLILTSGCCRRLIILKKTLKLQKEKDKNPHAG
jgi:hypothetical protein